MNKVKIRCYICGDFHKANTNKFPTYKSEIREVEVNGEKKKVEVLIGFVCKKCTRKKAILEIKKKIKQEKEFEVKK